jgi:hypothetical protein
MKRLRGEMSWNNGTPVPVTDCVLRDDGSLFFDFPDNPPNAVRYSSNEDFKLVAPGAYSGTFSYPRGTGSARCRLVESHGEYQQIREGVAE